MPTGPRTRSPRKHPSVAWVSSQNRLGLVPPASCGAAVCKRGWSACTDRAAQQGLRENLWHFCAMSYSLGLSAAGSVLQTKENLAPPAARSGTKSAQFPSSGGTCPANLIVTTSFFAEEWARATIQHLQGFQDLGGINEVASKVARPSSRWLFVHCIHDDPGLWLHRPQHGGLAFPDSDSSADHRGRLSDVS